MRRTGPYRRYLWDINMTNIPEATLRRRIKNISNITAAADGTDDDAADANNVSYDNQTEVENNPIIIMDIDSARKSDSSDTDDDSISSSITSFENDDPDTMADCIDDRGTFDNDEENSIDGSINTMDSDEEIYEDAVDENTWNMGHHQETENVERTVLYNGCDLTKEESKLLIMTFALRFNLSDKALESLLELIDCHLPSTQHGSLYMFLKNFPEPPSITTHFYCNTCMRLIQFNNNSDIVTCECGVMCEKSYLQKAECYFLQISLKHQLHRLLTYAHIRKELRCGNESQRDIINGDVYKKLVRNGTIAEQDISLQWNTDGVQVNKSSKMQLWPIQVCINELPFRIRKENMLLCGLWYGPTKPNMNTFLQPFVEECNALHNEGIQYFGPQGVTIIKVHTLLCSVDSMARPLLQNTKTFRGKKGCSFCLHTGEEYNVGRGKSRLYRGNIGEKRTVIQHNKDCLQIIRNGEIVNGIKGPSILMLLTGFNIIDSFVPDYMHCVLLGVVKTMLLWWMDGKNKDRDFYIGNDRKVSNMNKVLLSIKPPVEITRTPRSLNDIKLWKASEWKNFLLYYSCICLESVNMPKKYIKHWFLLVYSIYIFLNKEFSQIQFENAKEALKTFVLSIEETYETPELMKYNFHLLLHIPDNVKKFGGLWAVSAFPYEHFNGVLAKMFQNSRAIPLQICKNYVRSCTLQEMASDVLKNSSSITKHLFQKLTVQKYAINCLIYGNHTRLFGAPSIGTLTLTEKIVIETLVQEVICNNNISFFKRFIFKNVLYHTKSYEGMPKRANYIIQLENKEFIFIINIILVNTVFSNRRLCIILGKKLHDSGEYLYKNNIINITSNSICKIVKESNELVAIYPRMILNKYVITPHPYNVNKFCCFPLVNALETD